MKPKVYYYYGLYRKSLLPLRVGLDGILECLERCSTGEGSEVKTLRGNSVLSDVGAHLHIKGAKELWKLL